MKQEKWSIVPAAGRDELFARTQTRTENAVCHESVVYGNDVDLVYALRLELAILLNVYGRLRVAGRHEHPRRAHLSIANIFVGVFSWTYGG